LEGELLEAHEGALWQREWIEKTRVAAPPELRHAVVALDPADGRSDGDEQALCAAAAGVDGHLYVLRSEGVRTTPLQWLERAVRLARNLSAVIVVEKNFGGLFLVETLEEAMRSTGIRAPYRVIDAKQGKATRAEPIAALYEQARVHHVGAHPELEQQLVEWTGAPGQRSPDRLDACVHALRALTGYVGSAGSAGAGANKAVPYTSEPVPGGAVPWR